MFESKQSYEWELPAPMREPDVMYWRTVSLAWTKPWFVMVIRWSSGEGLQTFLIGSDADLVNALQSVTGLGVLVSLACCVPERARRSLSWYMLDIVEVWLGKELGEDAMLTVLVDDQRRTLGGIALEELPEASLTHLVARVGESVRSSPPTSGIGLPPG